MYITRYPVVPTDMERGQETKSGRQRDGGSTPPEAFAGEEEYRPFGSRHHPPFAASRSCSSLGSCQYLAVPAHPALVSASMRETSRSYSACDIFVSVGLGLHDGCLSCDCAL